MTKKIVKPHEYLFVIFCLGFFLIFILNGSTLPFVGNNAWNFNTYSLTAHNYVQFGFLEANLAPIVSVSKTLPENPSYYLHHPQLLSVVQSLFFYFLGESFFIARLPVILATLLSVLFIYLIAREVISKRYALLSLIVAVLLPGFVIFGRMIGQEAFVLLFCLVSLWSVLRYLRTQKKKYIFISSLGIVLGTLSDWPMVYFTLSLFPFLRFSNTLRIYYLLVGISFVTAALFILYSVWLSGGPWDLVNAFIVRGPGAVLSSASWFITWPMTILLRIAIYFNPLYVFFALSGFFTLFKSSKKTEFFWILVSLLIFGSFHILLYPEGSFGHAYWIYYLIPFIVFSSAWFLEKYLRNFIALALIITLSTGYFLIIEEWKTKELESNLFRYYFARAVATNVSAYDTIYLNRNGIFDYDMFQYQFQLNTKEMSEYKKSSESIVYSCRIACERSEILGLVRNNFIIDKKIYSHEA
jgi:hypothetical protein